jgi:peroxiredoxin Q/BCP
METGTAPTGPKKAATLVFLATIAIVAGVFYVAWRDTVHSRREAEAAAQRQLPALGSAAPVLRVTVDDGTSLDLASLYQSGPVLVYFYPKSGTSGCTMQARNIRDNVEKLTAHNLLVLGVSRDSARAQAKFRSDNNLPFPLVADTDGRLGKAYGVAEHDSLYARTSFLVVGGVVTWIQENATPQTQTQDAVDALEKIRQK